MGNIYNPHDKLFSASLKNLEIAKDFFKAHLPSFVLDKINFDTLKFCNTSFLDEELKEQCSDVLYYSKSGENTFNYLCILVEHQSTPKKLMPLRILRYQLAIIMQHLQEHPKATHLPIVFPILFYQEQANSKPYPYSLDILDLFKDKELAKQTLAKPAHLVDITQFSDEELKKHNLVALMEYLQKHARDRDLLLSIHQLKQFIMDALDKIGDNEILLLTYMENCLYYIMSVGNVSNRKEFIKELNTIPVVKEKIMGTLAHYFEEQGKAEEKKHIARLMLVKGTDPKFISEVTNLTSEEIQQIQTGTQKEQGQS
ncbi:MAG: Rpn family recombination-promoting nuclease/putative transposase [Gammaproteobacteria bacterium]